MTSGKLLYRYPLDCLRNGERRYLSNIKSAWCHIVGSSANAKGIVLQVPRRINQKTIIKSMSCDLAILHPRFRQIHGISDRKGPRKESLLSRE